MTVSWLKGADGFGGTAVSGSFDCASRGEAARGFAQDDDLFVQDDGFISRERTRRHIPGAEAHFYGWFLGAWAKAQAYLRNKNGGP
jgi:hypothetical protein